MKYFALTLATIAIFCSTSSAAPPVTEPPPVAISGGVTPIDDIGYYTVSYHYFNGRTGQEPLGWAGNFTDDTGIAAVPVGSQNGKAAFLLHPVWRGGIGDTDQSYRLQLPAATSIKLSFSIAMRSDAVGKSDGVTFRVRVNDQTLLDQNKADGDWSDYNFDLTRYAGQTITLVFESDPGPKHDPSFDFGLWGDRRLIIPGAKKTAAQQTRQIIHSPDLSSQTQGWGSASPTSFTGEQNSKIQSNINSDPSDILAGMSFKIPSAGRASATSIPFGNGGYLDLVAPDAHIVQSFSPEVQTTLTQTANASGSFQRIATYTISGRKIRVVADITCNKGGSVRVRVHSSDPYIAAVHAGGIGPTPMRQTIVVPYYGTVSFDPENRLFSNAFFDYAESRGSNQSGDTTEYAPLTDGQRITLDETIYYVLSPHISDVFPTPVNAPSQYRQTMANAAVLDYWGGDAPKFAQFLQDLASYGLTSFVTIVHNWQHGGYDQQLPSVLPANVYIGGDDGVRKLTSTAKALGERVAMHENYVDFYPNGPLYTQADIALKPDGQLIPAWSFPGHVSFLMTPVEMHKYAALITPEVHKQLGTNASYLDVHSAIPPWVHTDASANRQGAGMYETCINAQKNLWQYMRDIHGGPVLGEGNTHWYWSGMLDGVEAQFGQGIPSNAGETAPLFVDFDLLKIHPRQMNHGMGYVERWLSSPTGTLSQSQIDEYRMQEIAYGHSAFVSTREDTMALPFILEESNLVIPVASRYATAKVSTIGYEVGGSILNTDDAIAAGSAFDRVRISYKNGLTVYANARRAPWTVEAGGTQYTLPQYGWLASGPHFLAYTARQGTFARSLGSIYVNARLLKPADTGSAAPHVLTFKQTGPRAFDIALRFDVHSKIQAGESVFAHIVDDSATNTDGIVAQFGSGINAAPETWPVGQTLTGGIVHVTLPDTLHDGSYDIRVGLFNRTGDGTRLKLTGHDDGSLRYIIGTLHLSDGGINVTLTPDPAARVSSTRTDRHNFGVIATNGSVKMTRLSQGIWKLIPMPRDTPFTVELSAADIDGTWRQVWALPIDRNGKSLGPAEVLSKEAGRSVLRIRLPSGGVAYKLQAAR